MPVVEIQILTKAKIENFIFKPEDKERRQTQQKRPLDVKILSLCIYIVQRHMENVIEFRSYF